MDTSVPVYQNGVHVGALGLSAARRLCLDGKGCKILVNGQTYRVSSIKIENKEPRIIYVQ